jgi:hypothetical protein
MAGFLLGAMTKVPEKAKLTQAQTAVGSLR